jgi:ABC-2 type transport system ATP-binding protein
LVFTGADVAGRVAAELVAQGLDLTVDGPSVRCRLKGKDSVGEVLAGLGGYTAALAHVREIPMPLRDLIAQVYTRTGRADSGLAESGTR